MLRRKGEAVRGSGETRELLIEYSEPGTAHQWVALEARTGRQVEAMGMYRSVPGSDSKNEKTQKKKKRVMEESFIVFSCRFKHKLLLSNLSP